jgi:hypothetical protein
LRFDFCNDGVDTILRYPRAPKLCEWCLTASRSHEGCRWTEVGGKTIIEILRILAPRVATVSAPKRFNVQSFRSAFASDCAPNTLVINNFDTNEWAWTIESFVAFINL